MYDPSNFSALTYANGFTLWHYKSDDALKVILEDGYFNDAASMVRIGDFIFLAADTSLATHATVLIIYGNSGGLVTTVDFGESRGRR